MKTVCIISEYIFPLIVDAEEIIRGNEKYILDFLERLLLHYHCTFGNPIPIPEFSHNLQCWFQLILRKSSTQLTARNWGSGQLLYEVLVHNNPQLSGSIRSDFSLDRLMKVANETWSIPILFTQHMLYQLQMDEEFLLLLYLSFLVNKYSPIQNTLQQWASIVSNAVVTLPPSGDTPTQLISGGRPSQPMPGDTPIQPMPGDTPTQPMPGDTPTQPMPGDTPTQPMSGDMPIQPMPGDTPTQLMSGDTPTQPMSGDTPAQPMSGDTPTQPMSGDMPIQPISGDTPTQPMSGGMPVSNDLSISSASGVTAISPHSSDTPMQQTLPEMPSQSVSCDTDKTFLLHTSTDCASIGRHWLTLEHLKSLLIQFIPFLPYNLYPLSHSQLAQAVVTEVERHLDLDFQVSSDDLVKNVFPRILLLYKLYTLKDSPLELHDSAYLSFSSDIPQHTQLGCPINFSLHYVNPQLQQNATQDNSQIPDELLISEETRKTSMLDVSQVEVKVQEVGGVFCDLAGKYKDGNSAEFSFEPRRVGLNELHVVYKGKGIPLSPVSFQVFDPMRCCLVDPVPNSCLINEEVTFLVDISKAGPGKLTAKLTCDTETNLRAGEDSGHLTQAHDNSMSNQSLMKSGNSNSSVPVIITQDEVGMNTYKATCRLPKEGKYHMNICYNGIAVEHAEASVNCMQLLISEVGNANINLPTSFTVHTKCQPEVKEVQVKDPQGHLLAVTSLSRVLTYQYTATSIGVHTICVSTANNTSYARNVYHYDPALARLCVLTSQPRSLTIPVNQVCRYTVNSVRAGRGKLTAQLDSQSGLQNLEVMSIETAGEHQVSFTPTLTGKLTVYLKWNGTNVCEPIHLLVVDPSLSKARGFGLKQAVIGRKTFFTVETSSMKSLKVEVTRGSRRISTSIIDNR